MKRPRAVWFAWTDLEGWGTPFGCAHDEAPYTSGLAALIKKYPGNWMFVFLVLLSGQPTIMQNNKSQSPLDLKEDWLSMSKLPPPTFSYRLGQEKR